ncbi:hypothetical protein S225a_08370 [Candidatus Brocadiaceae bacterium S225]|nr:hypothetical protein S225a_08370 [Candidatus Brocadiaceae bacterium S225]
MASLSFVVLKSKRSILKNKPNNTSLFNIISGKLRITKRCFLQGLQQPRIKAHLPVSQRTSQPKAQKIWEQSTTTYISKENEILSIKINALYIKPIQKHPYSGIQESTSSLFIP